MSTYNRIYLRNQYDSLAKSKSDALRQTYTQLAQNIKGINRYNKFNGITGGAAETTMARLAANSQNTATGIQSTYNPQLAELYAQLQAYEAAAPTGGTGGGGRLTDEMKTAISAGRHYYPVNAGMYSQIDRYKNGDYYTYNSDSTYGRGAIGDILDMQERKRRELEEAKKK